MNRPPFIVFEGIEGSGKSTQVRLLADWLAEIGVDHLVTREPGGTPIGDWIREAVLHSDGLHIPPRTELLLVTAARAAFVDAVVRPALDEGRAVVSDRFSWSTLAYQGYGRELSLDEVRRVNDFATAGLEPDLYLVLDVPVDVGRARQARAGKDADRIERVEGGFLQRVREGYLSLARTSSRAEVVDGTGDPEKTRDRIRELLGERFPETFRRSSG